MAEWSGNKTHLSSKLRLRWDSTLVHSLFGRTSNRDVYSDRRSLTWLFFWNTHSRILLCHPLWSCFFGQVFHTKFDIFEDHSNFWYEPVWTIGVIFDVFLNRVPCLANNDTGSEAWKLFNAWLLTNNALIFYEKLDSKLTNHWQSGTHLTSLR